MTDARILLAKNMKRYREILGISQRELAKRIGCSTTFIGNIEINKRFPSVENLNKITNALEVAVSDLFAEQEPESMKMMASREEMKSKLEQLMSKAIDEYFKQGS